MTKQELQEIFESPFNWDNWRKVMDFIFPEFQYALHQEEVALDTALRQKYAQYIKQHGNTELTDGEKLVLYEVSLTERVRLDRNVKSVRKLISGEVFTGYQIGLGVFHNEDKSKWRFTLVIREFTPELTISDKRPESYTYVFGEGERGRTAAERFYDLSKIENKKLKDLEEAFSVEKLSKKFFTQYKDVYLEFVDNIKENPSRLNLFKAETKVKQEKLARDFVKKMMGRIVFLYFLQKKGWMGCKSKWQEGEDRFMQKLFEAAPHDSSFYMTYLEPLFFDTLNAKREKSEEDCEINGVNFGKVPFLNGGLFEREESHPENLTLDWKIFNRFFETLNNYNFTIIEDDPDFKEIAVDPEMLGHIFENLLEDNKDKGAFYTPKEIVQYMCQESLIEYLNTQLSKNIENEGLKDSIREFVVKQDFVALNDISQRADQYVLQALRDIKVCDPAIGSGAFPMGILHEIYRMVEYLQEDRDIFLDIWDKEVWDAARVKEDIIQNSIYGVDIEKGAVDIARLRFWLSIIIDEEEPKPLPNLDYKIVVGNSLLNKFEDHVIDIEWTIVTEGKQTNPKTLEFIRKRKELLEKISDKQKTYFDTESKNRAKLSQQIKDLKIDILINQLEMKIADEGTENEPKLENFSRKSVFVKAQKLYFQTLEWKDVIKELEGIKGSDKPFNHFDWKLDFPEILNPVLSKSEVGFDLVIANPPYLGEKGNKDTFRPIQFSELGSRFYKGQMDLFYYFFHKGIDLLKDEANLIFITTNYFITADGAIKLRYDLDSRTSLRKIINFNELRIFETALGQHNLITSLSKNTENSNNIEIMVSTSRAPFDLKFVEEFLWKESKSAKYYEVDQKQLFEGDQKYIRLHNPTQSTGTSMFDKITKRSDTLGTIYKVNAGIGVTVSKITKKYLEKFEGLPIESGDGVFVLSKNERKSLEKDIVKDFVKNSDINHYVYEKSQDALLYLTRDHNLEDYPNTKKHMSKFREILEDQIVQYEEKFPWYALNRPRTRDVFEDLDKIILPYRSKSNKFAYSNEPIYGSRDVLYIRKTDPNQNIKSLLAYLNSRIVFFWLYNKGKRKGDVLEMYQTPISEIPIPRFENKVLDNLAAKVDIIISNPSLIDEYRNKIDLVLLKVLGFEYSESVTIWPEMELKEYEYNNLSLKDMGL